MRRDDGEGRRAPAAKRRVARPRRDVNVEDIVALRCVYLGTRSRGCSIGIVYFWLLRFELRLLVVARDVVVVDASLTQEEALCLSSWYL